MMAKEKKKVPNLRFKGFTNDWEQRKVLELADRYDNLRVPITASERVAGETPYYGANGIQDYVKGFTHNGEFVLVAEDGANDLQNYPVQYVDGKVWVNNHAHVLQAKEERVDNKFLTNALKHTNIEPYLVGGGRAKLNADVMMKINFKVPTLPEQVQIGKFFDNLDHLIALQQRKLDLLKQLKKGFLQKMFAEKNSKQPVLRFKGFHDDWEQRKLGDEYKHIGNAFVGTASPYYTQNGYFYLESNNIKNGQINHDHEVFINESFYHKQLNKLLHTGDLVMVQSGHVGDTAVITEKYNGTAAHALIMFRKPKNNMLSFFLNSFFQSSNAKNRIDVLAIGNTIRHILASDMKKFVVYLPDNKEKGEVAKLFLELQKLISLQHQKLAKYQSVKKSLLQQMFI